MKKQVLSIAFITLLTLTSFAQLEKGSWIGGVSGNVGFSYNSSDIREFSLSLNPYALYLVSNNFAVGLNVDYSFLHTKSYYPFSQTGTEFVKYSTNTVLFAPIVRKYFGTSKYRPYVGITTGLSIYQTPSFVPTSTDVAKSTEFGYILNPEVGVSYWLNDKVFFDLKASYDLIRPNRIGDYHSIDLKIGIGIKLGNSSAGK